MKIYAVCFEQECGYCEPGVQNLFLDLDKALDFARYLNEHDKYENNYHVIEFKVIE